MADINFIPSFPKGIGPIEPGNPEVAPSQPVFGQGANFQDQLMQALGQINQEADQVAQASSSSYENVEQAMNQAQTAFSDTMQANQMMQYFLMNQLRKQGNPEPSGEEGAE